jgi:hypothetical protein
MLEDAAYARPTWFVEAQLIGFIKSVIGSSLHG